MNSYGEHFDAIVVGAGPAGSTAAYKLAQKGYEVLLIERGRIPGSKNVYGGKVYSHYIEMAYPGFEKEAPIHRWVEKERFTLLWKDQHITLEYSSRKPASFTAYLSKLTEWMAKKAEEAGTLLATEVVADHLIFKDKKVVGVESGGDRVYADTVIIAEGANRLLLERCGLAEKPSPKRMALGVKEVIKLDKKRINERFGLADSEGLSWIFLGDVIDGLPDGGFLYTFKDTVSLGIVVHLGEATRHMKENVSVYLEKLRLREPFRKLLGDGQLIEYSAHLTLEDPLSFSPKKYSGEGWMVIGDAAGFLANMGYTFRGVDFAVYSGLKAAEAYEHTRDNDDPLYYDRIIRETPMYREIHRYRGTHKLMELKNLFTSYPELIMAAFEKKMNIGEETPTLLSVLVDVFTEAWAEKKIPPHKLLKDLTEVLMRI